MAFPKNAGTMAAEPREDRLSDLPDGVLGHVLSFLGPKEAARAAVLARRYRHAFAAVHTLAFAQEEGSTSAIDIGNEFSYTQNDEAGRNAEFVALVDAALSCRRRCGSGGGEGGGGDPALRCFRVAFDSFHHTLAGDVDRWLSAAARAGGGGRALEELAVDARRQGQRSCTGERGRFYCRYPGSTELKDDGSDGNDDADGFRDPNARERAYRVPRWLYSSFAAGTGAGVRTLCLGSCFLDLPRGAELRLPSVETLALAWIPDAGRDIQRLVSGCPRLADPTVDSCRRLRALSVLDGRRLRRLALRCCHGARLAIDASDLRVLEYKGPVPDESVLSFAGSRPPPLASCDIEFCGKRTTSAGDSAEPLNLAQFLGRLTGSRRLRLGLPSSSWSCPDPGVEKISGSSVLGGLAPFPWLRHLELKGGLLWDSTLATVARVLERTPSLEVLTLLILPDFWNEVQYDPRAALDVADDDAVPPVMPRLREINVVHYKGRVPQRVLLRLLLRAAAALEEVCVVFPEGKYTAQTKLMREIESWVVDRPVRVAFA